jgi:hypothetical protein
MLEIAARRGTRNAVQAFAGAHPGKYPLVLGSWLPSQMICTLEITLVVARVWGVVEMLIHKIEYESDYGSLCDSHASIIT